jgi:hypothetical protein
MAKSLRATATASFPRKAVEILKSGLTRAGIKIDRIETQPIKGTKLHRIVVIAKAFDRISPTERQDLVWRIAKDGLDPDEQLRISMILTLGRTEAEHATPKKPKRFPTRKHSANGWQVFVVDEDEWVDVESKEEAMLFAQSPVLRYEALEEEKSGAAFARKLSATATVLRKYRRDWLARWFQSRAKLAREL